jgi:hypothetical protein
VLDLWFLTGAVRLLDVSDDLSQKLEGGFKERGSWFVLVMLASSIKLVGSLLARSHHRGVRCAAAERRHDETSYSILITTIKVLWLYPVRPLG